MLFVKADQPKPFLTSQPKWTEKNFLEWFNAERPDVVLGHTPEILPWIENLRKSVPGGIGFADLSITDHPNRCSGIDCNSGAIGRAAVDLLVELVESNRCGVPEFAKTVLLQSIWRNGNTTRSTP